MLHLLKAGTVVMVVPVGATITHDGFTVSPASITSMMPEGYSFVEAPPAPDPEPLTPEELRAQMPNKSMVEFRAALRSIRTEAVPNGIYAADINAKIDEIIDLDLQEEARDYFNLGQYAERLNPWVDILGAMFGLSPQEIDVLWAS